MDRNIPAMDDGIACAEKIMDYDPNARIIITSGYEKNGPNGLDDRTKNYIKGYLTKPTDIYELSTVLARLKDL